MKVLFFLASKKFTERLLSLEEYSDFKIGEANFFIGMRENRLLTWKEMMH
jgi:hypothetical protein